MKRRFWLILTVTILFGIEVPVCAIACLDAFDSSSEISSADSSHEAPNMPCHESESRSAPTDSGESHDDCGCDFSVAGLLSDSPALDVNSSHELGTFRTRLLSRLPIRYREVAITEFENELPPRDLLLLKSTFLI
ncbi:MAG TPA: hypothetical protein EYG08_16040 [Myxococcales bacterium]|nr:hypothetical protein [Myxococcales bacterium]